MAGSVTVLLVLLALVGLGSAVLAVRQRLPLRIALRNARRGRWRTVLVVLGLLVATTIISGSFVIGDTVNAVDVYFTYQALGHTDEGIYNSSPTIGDVPFPYSVFQTLNSSVAGDPQIAGMVPEILATTQALDLATHVPQTGLNLVGQDANQTGVLGAFVSDTGATLSGPSAGQVYLNDQAASDLNASPGDTLRLFGPVPLKVVVGAVVHDDERGWFLAGPDVFAPLATAQALENESGEVNFIAVANAGSVSSAVGLSDSVSQHLNATLATLHPNYGLFAYSLLQSALTNEEASAMSLSQLFLVLGLFSIVAGLMLIVGIFIMLAEERKGEMGMLRAIGLRRRQLVYTYYFEGLVYAAGSAAVGVALGVGVGYAMVYAFSVYFSTGVVTSTAILQSFTVLPISLLTAYVVGFVITVLTVLVTTAWISRLNIVRAIRSVPEPPPALHVYTALASLGGALAVLGGWILLETARTSDDLSVPVVAGTLLILWLGLVPAGPSRGDPLRVDHLDLHHRDHPRRRGDPRLRVQRRPRGARPRPALGDAGPDRLRGPDRALVPGPPVLPHRDQPHDLLARPLHDRGRGIGGRLRPGGPLERDPVAVRGLHDVRLLDERHPGPTGDDPEQLLPGAVVQPRGAVHRRRRSPELLRRRDRLPVRDLRGADERLPVQRLLFDQPLQLLLHARWHDGDRGLRRAPDQPLGGDRRWLLRPPDPQSRRRDVHGAPVAGRYGGPIEPRQRGP